MGKKKNKDVRMGWHFLRSDRKLDYHDGRVANDGETLSYTGAWAPQTCQRGMHASPTIAQAASFRKGPVLCRVEVSGELDTDKDKFAGRNRKIIWSYELTETDLVTLKAKLGTSGVQSWPSDRFEKRLDDAIVMSPKSTSEVQKIILRHVDSQRRKKLRNSAKESKGVLAWHFVREERTLNYGDGRLVEAGKTLSYTGMTPPRCCNFGMHASKKISDAARFRVGPWMCRVRVTGEIDERKNKLAGRNREVLWMAKVPKKWVNDILKARKSPYAFSEKELVRERVEFLMDHLTEKELRSLAERLGWDGI